MCSASLLSLLALRRGNNGPSIALLAVIATSAHAAVDLNQFTPDSVLLPYSVYATDLIQLPTNSGLASGGLVGSGIDIQFGDLMKLRSPYIGAGNDFALGGNNPTSVPVLNVVGNFSVGTSTTFDSIFQILGNLTSTGNDITFKQDGWIQGDIALSGARVSSNGDLQVGGAWGATTMTFGSVATVSLAATAGGPTILGTRLRTGVPFPVPPPLGMPLVVDSSRLPGYAVITAPAPVSPGPDVSILGNAGATDVAVDHRGRGGAVFTTKYWKCNLGLPYCHGDTLMPGEYGALDLSGNKRALLLTEGFYSFKSVTLDGGSAIIAAQPNGGRTVVVAREGMGGSSSGSFIGPDSARMATGFGGDTGQFLGGTMMVVSGGDMTIPSDLCVWATLSAPKGTVHLPNQVLLFGQIYAKKVTATNNADFGEGAFIAFRGLFPALFAPSAFSVGETADPACVDTSGKPCRDTVLTIRIPYVTAYTVRAKYSILETSSRQAILNEDFPYDTGSVVIAPGDSSFSLRVRVYDDSSYEAPETFRIVFDSLSGAGCPDANGNADTAIKSCDAVGTILDDDLAPRVRIESDSAVHEGDAGTRAATFTVRLLDPVSGLPLDAKNAPQVPMSFRWRTIDGTATISDSDYAQVLAHRDTLPFRGLSTTLSVAVRGDTRHERDEFFLASLDSLLGIDPAGSVLFDSGSILDDDSAPGVRIGDASIEESSVHGDTAWALFPITLSRPSGLPVTLQIGASDSSARSTVDPLSGVPDYVAPSYSITIPADSTHATLRIPILGDTLFEKDEFFKILLRSALDAVLDDSVGLGAITDADSAPLISVDTAWVQEPKTGRTNLVFRVHLSRPSGLPAVFAWHAAPGTARPDLDYSVALNTSASLRAGIRDTVLEIPVLADSIAGEGTETLDVSITYFGDLRPGKVDATGYIVDAQGLPAIAISDIGPFVEADTTVFFPVSLDWYPANAVRIPWHTVAGSAPAGVRWLPDSGEITIPAGERFASIPVRLRNDLKGQPDEQDFFVSLGTPSNARYGDSLGRATLLDDGDEPLASIEDADAVTEGNTARFRLRLNRATPNPVFVRWHFVPGTATQADVVPSSGGVRFEPGQSIEAWIDVGTRIDTLWEPTETFFIQLDSCANCTIRSADSVGNGSILEEGDVPRIAFLGVDTSVVEDRAGTVRVEFGLTRAASIPLQAALLLDPASTATRPADWSLATPADDTLRFPAGSRRFVAEIPVVPDTIEELTETVILGIVPTDPLASGSKTSWVLTILDDDHRPAVDIVKPVDSLRTNLPGHVVEWTVDGVPQKPSDTTLVEGWNRIERTYVDTFGHVAKDIHMVWGDFTPPEVHVFKIVGANPLAPERDTTWWGDRARTRFGVDTIWYWVRDSAKQDDGSWKVSVDTLVSVTDFSGDGVFPRQVEACDDLGNCGVDTGWIDLKQSIPVVTITNPGDGQKVKPGEVPVDWNVVDGGKTIAKTDVEQMPRPGVHVVERCWTDDVGNKGCDITHPVADTVRVVGGRYVDLDGDGRIDAAILTLDAPWVLDSLPLFDLALLDVVRKGLRPDTASPLADSTHLVVPVLPPFSYGITGFKEPQPGWIRQTWIASDSAVVASSDSFKIVDGTAPVILDAEIRRVENYEDPDTLWIKPSEPLVLDPDGAWLEVGSCPDRAAACDPEAMQWHRVPAESVLVASDGRLRILVQPGDTGSVRPGYAVRFLDGISDTSGNRVDADAVWSTLVHGTPRPELVKVDPPSRIPHITTVEKARSAPGGILIRASRGTASDGEWWEPGRGYVDDGDARVQEICPDLDQCNGPTLYINRPVRMILYIYDLAGTYTISRTVDITQQDIDALQADKIDRLHITLEWNHRSSEGIMVSTGIYVWRIIAQTHDDGQTSGLQNILWKAGVKVPR